MLHSSTGFKKTFMNTASVFVGNANYYELRYTVI